jgi:hypothetical protein
MEEKSTLIELFVSENKSFDPVRFLRNRVRVFVDRNYDYGLWIDEDKLFDLLTIDQKREYLAHRKGSLTLHISTEIAKKVVEIGTTPYSKSSMLRQLSQTVA